MKSVSFPSQGRRIMKSACVISLFSMPLPDPFHHLATGFPNDKRGYRKADGVGKERSLPQCGSDGTDRERSYSQCGSDGTESAATVSVGVMGQRAQLQSVWE